MMQLPFVNNAAELEALVESIGLLPFFHCQVAGFSLEECTPPGFWFEEGVEGAWEWREQVAAGGKVAYAKLFNKKAGFVGMDWYPALCNYRRNGLAFEERYEAGMASRECKRVMDALESQGPLLSSELKRLSGFVGENKKGFDTAITTLQMQTYVTIQAFEYKRDTYGRPYGWGVARYALADAHFGEDITMGRDAAAPEESRASIAAHVQGLFPGADAGAVAKLLR